MRFANLSPALIEDWQHGGFGLYIHWPFCQAKCPYCDFNSHVVSQIDQTRWRDAYLSEIDRVGSETQGRTLRSVFFGGGTPSLMDPETVDAILTKVGETWRMANDIEITLEANPTSVDAGRFVGYADAGVNRVSMGIQALNDSDLKRLGRLHSVKEAMDAFDIARQTFDRVSFDLIYARQDQDVGAWQSELNQALTMAIDHLSLYQLTIEQGTAFGDRYKINKLGGLPDEDLAADLYDITQETCDRHGFAAYEVSNHAKQGQESRHNLIYWSYGDYVGIGPGAHGRVTLDGTKFATQTPLGPAQWLKAVEAIGNGENDRTALKSDDCLTEFLVMGLRITDGVSMDRLAQFSQGRLDQNISRLIDEQWLEHNLGQLRVTQRGRPLLNEVLRQVLAD